MKQQHHVVSVYCESVKLIHEYPIHIASMYYSNVLHDMNEGGMIISLSLLRLSILHYPYDEEMLSMCNGGSYPSREHSSHRGSMVFHSIPMGLCVSASMTEATP